MDDKLLKHGRFSWNELMTTDVGDARAFYGKLFGWQYEGFPMENMTYEVIYSGGEEIGGMIPMPSGAGEHPPAWSTYITVDDVDATAKLAEALGGKIHLEPTDIPRVGRFAVLQDPQGAYIAIITYVKK